jgi:hypothetical protein
LRTKYFIVLRKTYLAFYTAGVAVVYSAAVGMTPGVLLDLLAELPAERVAAVVVQRADVLHLDALRVVLLEVVERSFQPEGQI